MKKHSLLALAAALLAGCNGGSSNGNGNSGPSLSAVGVTDDGQVVTFNTRNPDRILSALPITGVGANQRIVGLDQRPADDVIYAMSNTGVAYTLNPNTGVAIQSGEGEVIVDSAATGFDIDFNPTVDLIRLGNASGQNIRINPDTGVQVDGDPNATGVQGDGNFAYADASAAEIVGLAYTNSTANATSTTLYAIDRAQNRLVVLNLPNAGALTPVGPLGLEVTDVASFDIASDDSAALIALGEGDRTRLAQINLGTGAATRLDRTPPGVKLVAFAIVDPVPVP
jgi:hypothetical protein